MPRGRMKAAKRREAVAIVCISLALLAYFVIAATYTPFVFMTVLRGQRPPPLAKRNHEETPGDIFEKEARYGKKSPRVVLLWTKWRSGSTYIGELLAKAVPKTFYSIEPLHFWKMNVLHDDDNTTRAAMSYLHSLLHCDLDGRHQQQLSHMSRQPFYMRGNSYLSGRCNRARSCSEPQYVSDVCQSADVHVAKVLRLSLKWVWPLLNDDDLDLKVIFLVRDPRAVLMSRSRVSWCQTYTCRNPEMVCDLLENDLKQVRALTQHFPTRFKFIQYEKVNNDLEANLESIMSFLELPFSKAQLTLLNHIKVYPNSFYSTRRDIKAQVNKWRSTGSYEGIIPLQNACVRPLDMLRLRMFTSDDDFRNLSLPLVLA